MRWKILLAVIGAVIIAIIGWRLARAPGGTGTRTFAKAGNHGPIPVTVVPVEQRDVPIYLTTNGTVQALQTVTVQPQVSGRLLSIDFKGGDTVTQGQILAEIDPRTYQAAYDQAVSRMQSDEAQLATARGTLARSQGLIKQHYVSQQDLNTQTNTVTQLEASVAADRAAVAAAKINLDYTKINAPITGLAGIREVDPGNTVTTGSAIVVLTHVHPINVMFSLPAKDLDRVRAAQAKAPLPVEAIQHTGDQKVLAADGVLKVINNQIDPSTGTFTLKSEFPNMRTELWPGQYVSVRMQVANVQDGLVIPTQAVQRGPDGDYVYLLQKENTVRMQPITVADEVDDTHELISSGLAAGDVVVTEGQFRLTPGSHVRPLKPGEVPVTALADGTSNAAEGTARDGSRSQ